MQKSKNVIEQNTERNASKTIVIDFFNFGDSRWDSDQREFVYPQQDGEKATLTLLRRLAAEHGIEFKKYSWDENTINLEPREVIDETFSIEISGKEGEESQVFESYESRLDWFMENIAPILIEAGHTVEKTTHTTPRIKDPSIPSRLRNAIYAETPECIQNCEDMGVEVMIEELDLGNGSLRIKATSNGEDKNGVALESETVQEATKWLHDVVIGTLREFDDWDESMYLRDCSSSLEAKSVRVCDTSYLD